MIIERLARLKNTEIEMEPAVVQSEKMKKLVCIIDNQGNPVNHLDEGIKAVKSIKIIFGEIV